MCSFTNIWKVINRKILFKALIEPIHPKRKAFKWLYVIFDDVLLLYLIIIFIANKTLMYTTNNVIGSGIRTNLDSGFKEFGYNSDSYE